MRCVGRHRLQRLHHDFGDLLVIDLARRAAARLVIKAIEALFGKPLSPWSDKSRRQGEESRPNGYAKEFLRRGISALTLT